MAPMARLTADQVRRWRARSQGLYGDGAAVTDAVGSSAGLQAQDTRACRLQVRARTGGLTAGRLDAACADRTVVRGWLMRSTLHAVAGTDLRWLTALLGPRTADMYRGRRAKLGLDGELCGRALTALERVLAGEGVVLDPRGQAPAHLLVYAATRGLVCRGPEAAGDAATYVLAEEWLAGVPDPGLTGDEATAELAVRHVVAYGPATAEDFARWSGLPLGRARRGIAAAGDRIAEVPGPDGPLRIAAGTEPPSARTGAGAWAPTSAGAGARTSAGAVRLTGHFDPYLLGYRDRDLLLDPAFAARIATGGGFLMPSVLLDGAVVATWWHTRRSDRSLTIRVESLTGPPTAELTAGVGAEVADIARFLGTSATWEWTAEL